MNDSTSLDCGLYFRYVFDVKTGIWCHCDNDEITQIIDFPEGVYTRESHKKNTKNKVMSGSEKVIFIVYIITRNLIAPSSVFDKELSHISEINNMKEIMNKLDIFGRKFRDNQYVSDEILTKLSLIKYELQTCIEKVFSKNKNKEKLFWLDSEGTNVF